MARAGGHTSSAGPLAAAFALLIAYATLYPFEDWRWPPGVDLWQLMALPWPPWRDRFDVMANLLGYLPLGALIYGAGVRNGVAAGWAAARALLLASLLSFVLEVVQSFLPARVPSRVDWVLNSAGAAIGIALAALMQGAGWVERWQAVRDRWFVRRSAGALVLLLLWPVGLLFPAPVPLGLGQVGRRLRELGIDALAGTPWADAGTAWLSAPLPTVPLSPLAEAAAITLGLLAPCLVAFSVTRPGWRRVLLAVGAGALAAAVTALSNALNFAPDHALAWVTPVALVGLFAGVVLAALLAPAGRRVASGLGLVVLTALVALVSQAPTDPYYAQSLQAWEQGRFIRFHGLARWIGWLWPYFAMAWLLARIGTRDKGEP